MVYKKIVLGGMATLLLVSSFAPERAEACCGAAAAAINSQTSAQATQHSALLLRLDWLGNQIKDAIQDSANRINTNISKTAELQNQQRKTIFDLKNQTAKGAVCDGNSSSVVSRSATKSKGLSAVGKAVKKRAGDISSEMVAKTVANDKMHEQKRELVNVHNNDYCSQEDKTAGYCTVIAPEDLRNADIRADRFFLNAYDDGLDTDKDAVASGIFYQYLVGTETTSPIPAKLVKSNDMAKQLRSKQLELAAYSSIPKYVLAKIKAERTKNETNAASLGQLLEMDIANPSLIQVMYEFSGAESSRKIEEYSNMSGIEGKTSFYQQESLRSMAFTNYMLVKQYEQLQELSAVLSAKLANDLKPVNSALQQAISKIDTE